MAGRALDEHVQRRAEISGAESSIVVCEFALGIVSELEDGALRGDFVRCGHFELEPAVKVLLLEPVVEIVLTENDPEAVSELEAKEVIDVGAEKCTPARDRCPQSAGVVVVLHG